MGKSVLLGFSGGVDSCFVARKLLCEGYRVTGVTINTCQGEEQIAAARKKAEEIGIEFRYLDRSEMFREIVIGNFFSEYRAGRTPAPCTLCNKEIKWRLLYEIAVGEGYDHIATGHYFKIHSLHDKLYVARGADVRKDQSYYLWSLPQEVLRMALTPMGEVIKRDIVESEDGGKGAKESMSICFLRGESCNGYLRRHFENSVGRGEIVDSAGNLLGQHDGVAYYTIGQKRGLQLPAGMCVVGIDAKHNMLTAGYDSQLYHKTLILSQCNVADMEYLTRCEGLSVMIRGFGRNPEGYCRVEQLSHSRLRVELDQPAWAAAAGQPVVLYHGDKVMGGGYLEEYY